MNRDIFIVIFRFLDEIILIGSQYCEETTLHGFQYLTKRGLFSKLIWFLTIVSCLILAVILVFENIKMFREVK